MIPKIQKMNKQINNGKNNSKVQDFRFYKQTLPGFFPHRQISDFGRFDICSSPITLTLKQHSLQKKIDPDPGSGSTHDPDPAFHWHPPKRTLTLTLKQHSFIKVPDPAFTPPPGGGGAVLPYMGYIGMSRCESFQPVCSGIGYINQRVWVWSGCHFPGNWSIGWRF